MALPRSFERTANMLFGGLGLIAVVLACSPAMTQPMDEASGVLIVPPPRSAASATLDEQLDAHVKGWKQAAASIANYCIEFKLRRLDPFPLGGNAIPKDYTGKVLGMGQNHLRLRLDNATNNQDFEVYIRNDKSLFVYNGLDKTIIEYKPGQWLYAGVTDNP